MKKTYINPEMEIVKIQTMQMLAASEQVGFGSSVDSAAGAESHELDDDFDW